MDELRQKLTMLPLTALLTLHPLAEDFFLNLNLPPMDMNLTLPAALAAMDSRQLEEFGLTTRDIPEQLAEFLEIMSAESKTGQAVQNLTILGGFNKTREPEEAELLIRAGEVVSIVGPTGSGKSCLLADIECLAQRDTPTGRQVLINGQPVAEEERFQLEGKLVAQLSQNMNFVMDLTVSEFLEMHARSRALPGTAAAVLEDCFLCANDLAGEKFTRDLRVTQLSGGQSRALMIADTAFMSKSPIVLIDEIENAGVDRREAIALLTRQEKIVLISTHDPLLALSADKRIVIKNGGIFKIVDTTPAEKKSLFHLEKIDLRLQTIRHRLRSGENIEWEGE
jgi:ABC-type lipoprotein export system ATPase subunit